MKAGSVRLLRRSALMHGAGRRRVWTSGSLAGLLGLAALLGAAAASVGTNPGAALILFALVGSVAVLAIGWRALFGLLIGATFVTRFRLPLLGGHFMLEHLVLVVCLLVMIARGRIGALAAAAGDRAVVLFGGYVAWSALISVVRAPSPAKSLPIVGWLGLDWLLVVVVVAAVQDPQALARQGTRWLGPMSGAAVVFWVAALVRHSSFGVQTDTGYNGLVAASGLSWEANILASTLAVWTFVALTDDRAKTSRALMAAIAVACVAILLSLTRAAVVGLGTGVVIWAILGDQLARRTVVKMAIVCTAGILGLFVLVPGVAAPVGARASSLLDFSSGTGRYRAGIAGTAVGDLHGLDWVTGLGTNSFGQRHLDPSLPDKPTPAYLGNLPLQVVYDSGLIGSLLLGAALFTLIPRNRRRAARSVGLLVVYLACGSATSPLWFGFTWILMGIAVVARRRQESASGDHHQSRGFAQGGHAPVRQSLGHSPSLGRAGEQSWSRTERVVSAGKSDIDACRAPVGAYVWTSPPLSSEPDGPRVPGYGPGPVPTVAASPLMLQDGSRLEEPKAGSLPSTSRSSTTTRSGTARNIGHFFLIGMAASGVSQLALLLVARRLQPQNFGVLVVATTVFSSLLLVADFGMQNLAVQQLSGQERVDQSHQRYTLISLGLAAALSATGLLLYIPMAIVLRSDYAAVPLMLCGALPATFVGNMAVKYRIRERFASASAAAQALGVMTLGALAGTMVRSSAGAASTGAVLAMFLVAAVWWLFEPEERGAGGALLLRGQTGTLAWEGRYFLASALCVALYSRGDRIVVAVIVGRLAAGLYGAAYTLIFAASLLSLAVQSVILPRLVARWRDRSEWRPYVLRLIRGLWLVGIAGGAVLVLISERLTLGLYGASFAPAASVVRILSPLVPLYFVNAGLGTCLIACGRQRRLARIAAVNLGVALVLYPTLTLAFGVRGAAAASVAVEAGGNLMLLWGLRSTLLRTNAG